MEPQPFLRTLDELCAEAALALAVDYAGVSSGRVRDLPDRRTVRYYTTLGLVDRPAALRGRTALYGRRHLLQLVAIKRFQTAGLTLVEIQGRLLGLTDQALEAIARLPEENPEAAPTAAERPRGDAFWKHEPAVSVSTDQTVARSPPVVSEAVRPLLAVPLAEGATLLLHAGRPVDDHDVEALRTAAGPLIALLRKRRLIAEGKDINQEKAHDAHAAADDR
jgi:DNA-binding transcriptional MerR regulator